MLLSNYQSLQQRGDLLLNGQSEGHLAYRAKAQFLINLRSTCYVCVGQDSGDYRLLRPLRPFFLPALSLVPCC